MKGLQPRLFLSYSREDQSAAQQVRQNLADSGYDVFMDESGLLIGDDFVARLQEELARCDGIVFLHTNSSAASSWCHAEIYRALSLGLPLFRLRLPHAGELPDPLERLLSGVHFLQWDGAELPPIDEHLGQVRAKRVRRLMRRCAVVGGSVAVVVTLVYLSLSNWNAWQLEQNRIRIIDEILDARVVWSTAQTESLLADFEQDSILLGRLRDLQDDPAIDGVPAKFNAWQAGQYLAHEQERRKRWDLTGLDWSNVALTEPFLSNATIREGRLENVRMNDCMVAGVYFGNSPSSSEPAGLSLINTTFTRCNFWFSWFDKTQLLSAEFIDTKFRGAQIHIENFAATRFATSESVGGVLTPDLALFEDSLIVGRSEPPEEGVLDLAGPEHEVIFESVEFVRVSFEGWFRPSWFRNSNFVNCTFPPGFPMEEARQLGNSFEGAMTSN